MQRLIHIEWLKLRHNRIFSIIILFYLALLVFVPVSVDLFFKFLESKGANFEGVSPSMIPFYDFPDIWQNITYMTSFIKLVPAFLVIISVTNEFGYKTIRQNIIDGMDRVEFFLSKQGLIICLALVQVLIILVVGLIMGFAKSSVTDFHSVMQDIVFLPVHLLELIIYFNLAFLFSLLVKKAGYAIMLLILYNIMIEPLLYGLLYLIFKTSDYYVYLPIASINKLISVPYQRYVFMEIQDFVALRDLLVASFWGVLIVLFNYRYVVKRDL
jgi:ABC-2 type transport system permease protein